MVLSLLGAVLAPLWPLMTYIEIDDGWGHFYWENPALTEKLAWLTSACAAVAAIGALLFAWRLRSGSGRRPATWFVTSAGVEIAAIAGWISVISY